MVFLWVPQLTLLQKLANELGGRNDTQELRERMQEGRRVTNSLCKETSNLLRVCVCLVFLFWLFCFGYSLCWCLQSPVDRSERPKQDKLKRTLQTVSGLSLKITPQFSFSTFSFWI